MLMVTLFNYVSTVVRYACVGTHVVELRHVIRKLAVMVVGVRLVNVLLEVGDVASRRRLSTGVKLDNDKLCI